MTTAYTSLLGLALPVTGELSGTWGDTVNDSITSLLDSAVAGTTTLSTDADVTLSSNDGTADTSRQAILLWTAGGTVTRNITAPAQSKIYTVINKSSSTQSIVLRGAGPTTGVTIVQGESAVCAWNGSDFIKISNTSGAGVFTTLSVSGAVTLSGGTANGVAYLNGSKMLTTGSALGFDGTNLLLGTPSVLTSGKFSLQADLSAVNAMTLRDSGTTYGVSSYYTLYQNSAGSTVGGIGHTAVTSLGINATTDLQFFTAATERMRLDSSGNVGIGTSSPQIQSWRAGTYLTVANVSTRGQVEIDGAVADSGSASLGALIFTYSTNTTNHKDVALIEATSSGATANQRGGVLNFYTKANGTASPALNMTLDSSGNLGLGVTPSAWASSWAAFQLGNRSLARSNAGAGDLTMVFNGYFDSTDSRWEFQNSGDYAARYSITGSGIHSWHTSTAAGANANDPISFTQAMTLDASGNLGIGTTTPTSTYSARLASLAAAGTTALALDAPTGTNTSINWYYNGTAKWSTQVLTTGEYRWYDFVAGSTRMTLDASGNLLVGTTSTVAGAAFVVSKSVNDYLARFINSNATAYGVVVNYSVASPNSTGQEFLRCVDSTADRMTVRSNGGIANYSANNVNLSDRREKTNFAPAKSYLDVICAIPVQTFNYIDQNLEDDAGLTLGVVAQDVQAVAPELVMESNWGTEEEPKMRLSIYQTDLQYALMKCIQEQQAIIQSLTARITALESA